MSEIYRLALQEDAERLQYVTYEAYETIRQLELRWPAAQADVALIQENIKNNDCYVLEVDSVIQATVSHLKNRALNFITDLPFVMWFAVDPAAQGKGYGKKLLNWVEQTIIRDKVGAPAVTLATAEKHPYLLSMYERWGYERIHAFDHGTGDGTMHLLRKVVNPELFSTYIREKNEAETANRN